MLVKSGCGSRGRSGPSWLAGGQPYMRSWGANAGPVLPTSSLIEADLQINATIRLWNGGRGLGIGSSGSEREGSGGEGCETVAAGVAGQEAEGAVVHIL